MATRAALEMTKKRRPEARLLVATDFDGTIAPIVRPPNEAALDPYAASVLQACSMTPGIEVAIISERDVDDVRRRVTAIRALIAGSHGL